MPMPVNPAVAVAAAPTPMASKPMTVVTDSSRVQNQELTPVQIEQLVRREAYRLAEARNFRGGSPVEDWLTAEMMVKSQLHARGVMSKA